MAIMQIKILPLGTGSTSVGKWVAGVMKLVEQSGLKHQLTPMSTIIEGDLDDLFALARRVHEAPFQAGAQRVVTIIEIDDRRDRESSMERKIRSVEQKLSHA